MGSGAWPVPARARAWHGCSSLRSIRAMSNCVINSLSERLVGVTSQAIWVTCMGSCRSPTRPMAWHGWQERAASKKKREKPVKTLVMRQKHGDPGFRRTKWFKQQTGQPRGSLRKNGQLSTESNTGDLRSAQKTEANLQEMRAGEVPKHISSYLNYYL